MKTPILPNQAYTSQAWFDKEQELIFSNTWQFAGFVEDMPNKGDYITVQAGLTNIIVIRTENQKLSAFHNMCRHRGAQLLRAVGKDKKVITCPYHDWTYKTDGTCINIPSQETEFPNTDKKDKNLIEASVAVWKSMIFVHPDKDAESLASWLGEFIEYTGPHKPKHLIEYDDTKQEYTIEANWKLIVENFIDVYHLPHLHSGTLSMYNHKLQKSGFIGKHFYFYEPLSSDYEANLEKHAPYPLIDHIPEHKRGAYTPLIFPNLGLGETESSWSTFHLIPLSPNKTKVVIRSKLMYTASASIFSKQAKKSKAFWNKNISSKYGEYNHTDPLASADFMQEDIYACEQMQKSLQSPYYSVNETAVNLEKAIRDFQNIILEYIKS